MAPSLNKKPPSAAGELVPSTSLDSPSSPLLLLLLSFLLRLLALFLSLLFPTPSSSSPLISSPPATRSLFHILSLIPFIPISSRKYHFVRSLADRLLDENLLCSAGGGLRAANRSALGAAFERTIRRLEAEVPRGGAMDRVAGAILGGLRRVGVRGGGVLAGGGGFAAEKLAAEGLWLAQKMDECGSGGEAAARWAAAAGLGRSALLLEPRAQVAFVRLSVFLFRNAHRMQVELYLEDHDEDDELGIYISQCCLSMLRTWLPLLCRASNGIDSPILNSSERTEMVRVLEEMIQKLNWEQQEEVLALWLYHFTSCPDSDWPNLESSYTRWYAQSRKLLLQ